MNVDLLPAAPDTLAFDDAALRLHPQDTVAIARRSLAAGTLIRMPTGTIHVGELVPSGHKFALVEVAPGGPVLRYGQYIGEATRPIRVGDHVHLHNLTPGVVPQASVEPAASASLAETGASFASRTFMGFRRRDGSTGTRNYVAVITSVNCAAFVGRQIAAAFTPDALRDFPHIDGVIAFTHLSGCAVQTDGDDYVLLQRTLAGMALHPNVAGYLMMGLGCETNQIPEWIAAYGLDGRKPPFAVLTIQEAGGTAKAIDAGIRAVRAFLPEADAARRSEVGVAELTVALQCGGSDGWSGVTANPLVGRVSDRLVGQGGRVVLSETPEIHGAEHLLLGRAVSTDVAARLRERIAWWEQHARQHHMELNNNPSAGNKVGGLTTIYEKSLGAVAKGGSSPLCDVVGYAQPVTARGLTFMDTPGNDPVSATGQVAGGCTLILFTTGRGSVFGFRPAPSLKICSNSRTFRHMADDMDFNAGVLLEGTSFDDAAHALFEQVLAFASGAPSRSERLGIGADEFNPWNLGGML
jgi:altronate hydrolase